MSKVHSDFRNKDIVNVLYYLVSPMLGCHDCVKCISESSIDVYTTDVVTLLSSLDFEWPIMELLFDVLKAHKSLHKRGTKSLLYMILRLTKAVFLLEQWGITTALSLQIIQKAFTQLTALMSELAIDVFSDKADAAPKMKTSESNILENHNQLTHDSLAASKNHLNPDTCHLPYDQCSGSDLSLISLPREAIQGIFKTSTDVSVGDQEYKSLSKEINGDKQSQTEDFHIDSVEWFFEESCNLENSDSLKSVNQLSTNFENTDVSHQSTLFPKDIELNSSAESTKIGSSEAIDNSSHKIGHNFPVVNKGSSFFHSHLPLNVQKNDSVHVRQDILGQNFVLKGQDIDSAGQDHDIISCSKTSQSEVNNLAPSHQNVKNHATSISLSTIDHMLKNLGRPTTKTDISLHSRHLLRDLQPICQSTQEITPTLPDQDNQMSDSLSRSNLPSDCQTAQLGQGHEIQEHHSISDHIVPESRIDCTFPELFFGLDSCHKEWMAIVKQLYLNQLKASNEKCFNPNLVDSLHAPAILGGTRFRVPTATTASVYEGLLVVCKSTEPSLFSSRKHHRTLLINADLTPTYRHKGYKPMLKRKTVVSDFLHSDIPGDELKWEHKVLDLITQLGITLVFVRGQASDSLINMCSEVGVAILTHVPFKTLSILSSHCHVVMLNYIEQSSQSSICTLELDVIADKWLDFLNVNDSKSKPCFYLHITNVALIQTVILSASCPMSSQLAEERFWKCVHAVANASCDGKLLPGSGQTERWCAAVLKDKSESLLQLSNVESIVLEALAEVFLDFSRQVDANNSLPSDFSVETGGAPEHLRSEFFILNSQEDASADVNKDTILGDHWSSLQEDLTKCFSYRNSLLSVRPAQNCSTLFVSGSTCGRTNSCFYDNFCSKLAVWETSIDAVCMLVNLASSIQTGVSPELADF